jgi:tetratricopeptide (TPR) repeat protein
MGLARSMVPLLVLALTARVARADDSAAERRKAARVLWSDGQAAFNTQRYDEAIDLYLRAYKLNPSPLLLMNLAQCYRKKRDHENAIFYYKAYLRDSSETTRRAEVEEIITLEEGLLQQERVNEAKPPDGVEPPSAPTAQDVEKSTRTSGNPQTHPDALTGSVPPSQSADPSVPAWYQDRWAWVVTGTGAAASLTGGAFLLSAALKRSDADAARDEFTRRQLNDAADSRRGVGTVTLVSGGVITAIGVGLLIYNPRQNISISFSRAAVSFGVGFSF